jgi:hypothetical protein
VSVDGSRKPAKILFKKWTMPLVDKGYGTSEAFLLLLPRPYILRFYYAETMRIYVSFFYNS